MTGAKPDVAKRFGEIAKTLLKLEGVALGSGKPGFGSSALQVNGKIFAMISSKNEFVVKLPKGRVSALVALGRGINFELGSGRLMKEWFAVSHPAAKESWLSLAREALAFVGSR